MGKTGSADGLESLRDSSHGGEGCGDCSISIHASCQLKTPEKNRGKNADSFGSADGWSPKGLFDNCLTTMDFTVFPISLTNGFAVIDTKYEKKCPRYAADDKSKGEHCIISLGHWTSAKVVPQDCRQPSIILLSQVSGRSCRCATELNWSHSQTLRCLIAVLLPFRAN